MMPVSVDERGRVLPTPPRKGDPERRTIPEWNQVLRNEIAVIDPDGFDRSDPDLFHRLFTEEEFRAGSLRSTCRFGPDFLSSFRRMDVTHVDGNER